MKEILQQFDLPYDVQPYGDGHINETYCVRQPVQFILQKLNTHVFHDPDSVLENIVRVTEHLKKKIEARGGSGAHLHQSAEQPFLHIGSPHFSSLLHRHADRSIPLHHCMPSH